MRKETEYEKQWIRSQWSGVSWNQVILPVFIVWIAFLFVGGVSSGLGQEVRDARGLYLQYCSSCHGADMDGGNGGSLLTGVWKHGSSDEEIARVIADGLPDEGMPGYSLQLSSGEILDMVRLIQQAAMLTPETRTSIPDEANGAEDILRSGLYRFRLETVLEASDVIWGMAFLPDGSLLYTLRSGQLMHRHTTGEEEEVQGTPGVWAVGQGGLLAVTAHPDYQSNGWVYLGFSEHNGVFEGGRPAGMTTVVRGRISDGRWVDHELIYRAPPRTHTSPHHHFGTRIVIRDGYLYFGVGDRGRMEMAQELSSPAGKIHRLHDDGRIPDDNPFRGEGELRSIWSFGHRNPQGMVFHPANGDLWIAEHGPRGGDELNLVRKGLNYGWPLVTYGINYDGTPITEKTSMPGMEDSVHQWTPSIAVCGITFYTGEAFPDWSGCLFAGGLVSEQLHRIEIADGVVIRDEVIMKGHGRIRDVVTGPDGLLYVALYRDRPRQSRIIRLVPVFGGDGISHSTKLMIKPIVCEMFGLKEMISRHVSTTVRP